MKKWWFLEAYQTMKQDQYSNSSDRIKSTVVQSGTVIGQNDGVIGDTDDPENQQDHDRAQTPQGRTKLEHIPSHRSPRSMHDK